MNISKNTKGWLLLSVGTVMVSTAFGLVYGIPVALGIAGVWVIVYGAFMFD